MHYMESSIVCTLLLAVLVNRVAGSGEYHADEGGKFSAFKNRTDFAERELRKVLNLKPEDQVHITSVSLQIKDGHLFNVTMCVQNARSCSVIVHEREGGNSLEVIKGADHVASCVDLPIDDTRHEVNPSSI